VATTETTRVPYSQPEPLSIAVSQLVFPSTKVSWRPNAVIVFTGNDFRSAIPAVSLVHHPIHAALLYSQSPTLSQEVLQEIWRLQPTGKHTPAHVIAVGPFQQEAIDRLHELGYTTLLFGSENPVLQSVHIAQWRKQFLPIFQWEMILKNTLLVPLETVEEALPALGFSAHRGTPILYTYRDELPPLTRRYLQRENGRNISIVGTEKTVSATVEEACRRIVNGIVERFDGEAPGELAVNFARKRSQATGMGWGRNQPMKGDVFTFFPADWRFAMIASSLSHMGKHAPLLPLHGEQLPDWYVRYLQYLRPRAREPQPPFMHAFLLGDLSQIPLATEVQIAEHIMFRDN
jgi:hypothetical protein